MTPFMIEQQNRILAILATGQKGHIEVAQEMGFSRTAAQKYMRRMHEATPKLIYACGYEQPLTGGFPRTLYAPGDLPDVEYHPKYIKKSRKLVPRSQEKKAQILALLSKPMTGREVSEIVFLCYEQTLNYIKSMREATPKQVFIKDYKRPNNRGQWAPIYAAGNKPDAPHPPEQTRAERYKKERSSDEQIERINKRRQHQYLVKTLKKSPVNWASALGL